MFNEEFKNSKKLIKRILFIITLTNIIAMLCLCKDTLFQSAYGYILGSIASVVNFLWLAINIRTSLGLQPGKTQVKAVKGFYLRFLFLIIYSVFVAKFLKPNILFYGLGLLSSQIAVYINILYTFIRENKYFRG